MKKSIVIELIISLTVMLFAVLFVACDNTVRHNDGEHVYSFYSDETKHFEECVCGDTKNEEEHTFDENGICSVCGYDKYLIYELQEDGQSYRVEIDRDAINGISCYVFNVPDTFKGLPVKEIAPSGFRDSHANKITTGKNVETIGSSAFERSSVKEIGQEAFAFSAIKSIVLPDNISLIPHGCFQQCRQLQSLTLGASVSYLSEYCFDGCSSLQHLYIKASDFPPVCQDETFVGAEQLFEQGTLHVPYGCQSIYRKHAVWGQFRNIVEESF